MHLQNLVMYLPQLQFQLVDARLALATWREPGASTHASLDNAAGLTSNLSRNGPAQDVLATRQGLEGARVTLRMKAADGTMYVREWP